MRNLFLVLVLANLGFAAWQSWFAEPPPPPIVASVRDVPSIQLMSELPEPVVVAPATESIGERGPASAGQVDAMPTQPEPPPERCVSVGPFRELSQAATATANLRTTGYDPVQRVAEGDIWVGYWVFLPGIPTRERAQEILATLQSNGISDAYSTPGDEGFLISLGVFSEISRAGRLREEVRGLGFEPTVVDRTRRGTVYWIDVILEGGQTLDFEALQTPGRIIRLEQRACDSAVP